VLAPAAVRGEATPDQAAEVRELLTDTYQAVAAMLAKIGEGDAAWIAVDRAAFLAEATGSPLAVAASLFRMVHTFLSLGLLAQAQAVATAAAAGIDEQEPSRLLSMVAPESRGGVGVREQLRLTLRGCMEVDAIRELVQSSPEYEKHFSAKAAKSSDGFGKKQKSKILEFCSMTASRISETRQPRGSTRYAAALYIRKMTAEKEKSTCSYHQALRFNRSALTLH
jgi:hypothetical protein